jgi:hypothetical protein
MKNLLKEYVELTLNEDAASPDGLALNMIKLSPSGLGLILWDPNTFASIAEKIKDASRGQMRFEDLYSRMFTRADKWVLGMIWLGPKNVETHWQGSEVRASAARQGYGPTLYDIAMGLVGTIYSDRKEVSPEAEGVWDFYLNRRSDVKHLPFDDIDHPKTPPIVDDSEIHKGHPALNYAYKGKGIPSGALRKKNGAAIRALAKQFNESEATILELITNAGQELFRQKYTNVLDLRT